MSFSFGGGGGFGFGQSQPAQSPFGGTAAPFGQTSAPFGQQQASSPFGAGSSPGMFGATQPAFGVQSTPAFGASTTPAFGAGGFGAGGFGAGSSNPFGGASQPAFGAASTPAFGASTPAFGSTGFGASTPAFGATGFAASTPAFGAGAPAPFGSPGATPAFGSSAPAFGGGFGLGGGSSFGGQGTRGVPFQKQAEADSSATGGAKTTVYYNSISAMPAYNSKSHEELRWEDYQAGCKGNTGTAPPGGSFGQPSGGLFGQPQGSAAFGQASTPAFGAASSPAFGAASSPSLFGNASLPAQGGFGFGSTPAFGATTTPAFGASSSPAFGQTAASFGNTSFGAAFGQSSAASVFGASSTPSLFGASTPAFGSTTSSFGTGGSIFGQQQQSSPGFGQPLGPSSAASSSPFTFNTGGAFGASSTPSLFGSGGAFGQSSTPAFGQTGSSIFGQQAAKPFGGGLFGQQSSPGFGAPQSQSAFGTGSIFGQPSSPSLFGGQNTFNFSPQGAQQQQQAQQQLVPAQPLGVATSPYGMLPVAPELGTPPIPENRVGIAARPMSGLGPPRQTAFVAARSLTPRSGARLRPTLARRVSRLSASPAEQLLDNDGSSDAVSSPATSIFVMRDNPRQFFVRQPLPSTASAQSASPAHSKQPEEAPSEGGTKDGRTKEGSHPQQEERGPAGNSHAPNTSGKEPTSAKGDSGREAKKPQKPDQPGKGRLTDDQVAELLPKLSEGDYSIEPSLTQLAAMARDDAQSLAGVSGFRVSRQGVGAVRWLEPTDVRGLDVNGTVRLTKGAVEVYLEEADKPDIGEGLNRAAEVTLHKVYKVDKASNRPSTDPADFEKYERKLKKLAAAQGARFISYDGKSGTWVFEVEHFSRYGLPDDSDDEEMPSKPGTAPRDQGKAMAGTPMQEPEEEGMQLSDEDEDGAESQQGTVTGIIDAAMTPPGADGAEHMANSPVMHVALSARLGLDPSEMAMYHSDMFPSGGKAAVSASRRKRAQSRSPAAGAAEAFESQAPRVGPLNPQETIQAQAQAAPAAQPAVTSWRQGIAALQPPNRSTEGGVLGRAEQSGAGTLVPSSAGPPQHAEHAAPEALGLVDAGLMAGHSFRVGWAPGGRFARVRKSAGHTASSIALACTPFGEGVLPDASSSGSTLEAEAAVRLQERCKALLQIHMRHSSAREATAGSAAAVTHQRAMRCSRSVTLHGMVQEVLKAMSEQAAKHEAEVGESVAALVARHERQTWELLDVLFSEIRTEGTEEQEDETMGANGAFCAEPEGWSAAAERRSRLSAWFRDQASSKVDTALKEAGSELQHLLQLLTGQRMAAAVALASASGDIRLAMLLCQAAAGSDARAAVEKQLALWQDTGFASHMDPGRMLIYELLAGHVNHVVPQLQLDWRRAFALHLWYGEPPAAPLAASLEAYEQAIQDGAAPPPVPLYMEGQPPPPFQYLDQLETAPIDVDYRLMELAAGGPNRADPAFLATLLSPLALSPDPLDHLFPWMLLQTLQAIDAIPSTASSNEVCAVHMSLISQLERLGDLEEWALYIALHLPDGGQGDRGLARDDLVLQLLHRHAPTWAASQKKQDFLTSALGLPPAWLASALATFAAYNKSRARKASSDYLRIAEEEYGQRIAAGDWAIAHELFAEELAPRWWLGGRRPRLRSALQPLLQRTQEAQAQVPSAQWRTGAELYAAYFHLEDMYKSRSPLYDEDDTVAKRMEAVSALGRLLQQTSSEADTGAPTQWQLYRQAVYSSMSKHLADCLLTDGGHAPKDIKERQLVSVGLHMLPEASRMHHIQIAAAALGEVLA